MNPQAVQGLLLTITVLALIAIVVVFTTQSDAPLEKSVQFQRIHKNFFQLALPQTQNSKLSYRVNEKINFTHKQEILLPQPSQEGQIIQFPKDHLTTNGFLYFGPRRSIVHPAKHCIAKFGPRTEVTICKAVVSEGLLKWQITGSVGLPTKKLTTNDISMVQFTDILNALTGGLVFNVNGGSEVGVSLLALVQAQAALDSEVTEPIDPTVFCATQNSVAPSQLLSAGQASTLQFIQTTLNSFQTTLISSQLNTKLSVASSQYGQPSADPNLVQTLSSSSTRSTLYALLQPYFNSMLQVLQSLYETNPGFTNNQSQQYLLGNNQFVMVFALSLYLILIQELACVDTNLVNGKYPNPWQSPILLDLQNIWNGVQSVQSESLYASALMWTTIQNTYVNNYIYGNGQTQPSSWCGQLLAGIANLPAGTQPTWFQDILLQGQGLFPQSSNAPVGTNGTQPRSPVQGPTQNGCYYIGDSSGQCPPAQTPIPEVAPPSGVYVGTSKLGVLQTSGQELDVLYDQFIANYDSYSNNPPLNLPQVSTCQPDNVTWNVDPDPSPISNLLNRAQFCLQNSITPNWYAVQDTNTINNGGPVPFSGTPITGNVLQQTTNLTQNGEYVAQSFGGIYETLCPQRDLLYPDGLVPFSTITCSLPNTIHCPAQNCGAFGLNCSYNSEPDIFRMKDVAAFFQNPEQNYLKYLFSAGGLELIINYETPQGQTCPIVAQWQAPLPFSTFAWPDASDPSILLPVPDLPSWWTNSQIPRGTPFGYWSGSLSDQKAPLQCTSISLLDAAGTPVINTGPQNSISETTTLCKTPQFDSVSTVASNVSAYFNSATLAVSSNASIGCIPNTPDDQTTNLGGRIANASSVLISCFDPSVESPGVQGSPAANSRLLFCGSAEATNILSERSGLTDLACDPPVSSPPSAFTALFTGYGGFQNGYQTQKFTTTNPIGKEIRTTSCVVKVTQELNSYPQLPHTVQNLNVYANVQRNTQEGFWFLSTTNTAPFLNLILNVSTITIQYTC